MTHHRCPEGCVIVDERTDELVTDRTAFRLEDGTVLRLRLARGRIVETDEQPEQGERG